MDEQQISINDLKEKVNERRSIIQAAQRGNGHFYQPALGITINRFTINEVLLLGEAARTAELKVKEQHEKDAETIEIDHVLRRAQELMKGLGISAEDAIQFVQSERGKVGKTIDQKNINIAPETLDTIRKALSSLRLFK